MITSAVPCLSEHCGYLRGEGDPGGLEKAVGVLGGCRGLIGHGFDDPDEVLHGHAFFEQASQHALHRSERKSSRGHLLEDHRVLGLYRVEEQADVLAATRARRRGVGRPRTGAS